MQLSLIDLPSRDCARPPARAAARTDHRFRPLIHRRPIFIALPLIGRRILTALSTLLGSLQIAAGLMMSIGTLSKLGRDGAPDYRSSETARLAGIISLGFPLLARSGSVSWVILEAAREVGSARAALVIAGVLASCAALWVVLRAAQPLGVHLGRRGINAVMQVFALLLAVSAVDIAAAGVSAVLPTLA